MSFSQSLPLPPSPPNLPFDAYALHLFRLVAETGSFTGASRKAGLTQSALTRQIQGMESRVGVALLERTTRAVRLTGAGQFLLAQATRILGDIASTAKQLHEEFATAPRTIRVGVTRTVGLAYLPGFFAAYQRRQPEVRLQVNHQAGADILLALEARELDVGILCPPDKLAKTLRVAHRFADDFTVIAPAKLSLPAEFSQPVDPVTLSQALADQRWLLIDQRSNTGRRLREWMDEIGLLVQTGAMEADSFDLIVNLVSLGHGVSLVPHRALPLYLRRRAVRRIALTAKFSRELAVVASKAQRPAQAHVRQFVESVLF